MPTALKPKPLIDPRMAQRVHDMADQGLNVQEIARLLRICPSVAYDVYHGRRKAETRYRCETCGGWNLQTECLVCANRIGRKTPLRLSPQEQLLHEMTVEELIEEHAAEGFVVRTCNALLEHWGVQTVLELLHLTRDELRQTPTLGKRAEDVIFAGLKELGLADKTT